MNRRLRKMQICQADVKDILEISMCGQRCLPIYYHPHQILGMIVDDDHVVLKVVIDNKIIGYFLGEYQKKRNFHILSFGIDVKHRKKGIGRDLIEFTRKKVKKNNNKTMSLNVHIENEGAISFYKKCGFNVVKVRKNYYNGGLKNVNNQDAYFMQRKCSQNPR